MCCYICNIIAVLKNLTNLKELNLSANGFSGSLPGSLLELPHLDPSGSSLAGRTPINSSLEPVSLQVLNLNNNRMSGALPTERGKKNGHFMLDHNIWARFSMMLIITDSLYSYFAQHSDI